MPITWHATKKTGKEALMRLWKGPGCDLSIDDLFYGRPDSDKARAKSSPSAFTGHGTQNLNTGQAVLNLVFRRNARIDSAE